ncbi:MAG: PhnD/SsuA/transferrin family substrate-binding protein [Gallionella sp.]|nr:PhnD/SsuA/transferrin family substrate-binding protein [Gallionella sp.]
MMARFGLNHCSLWGVLTLLLLIVFSPARADTQLMRLGLSAVMIGEQQEMIQRWRRYLEAHLHRPVEFVQRRTYQETMELFRDENIDAGWICGGPHVAYPALQRILAVGVWKGSPHYQSYLIVPAGDTTTRSIADLRGKVFGYSDPQSNSGHNVPIAELLRLGENPERFFGKTLYTYSHRKLVEGVAAGLFNGARVDGYIYEEMRRYFPALVAQTRLVNKSEDFGFPPIVARSHLPKADYVALQTTLLNMQNDEEGRALLELMGLDGFIKGDEHLFDGIAALLNDIKKAGLQHARKN